MRPYIPPKLIVLSASREGDVTVVVCEFDRLDLPLLGPAGLYLKPNSGSEAFQLHRLVATDGLILTFESYGWSGQLPKVGKCYFYRGWWLPEAMEAVLDAEVHWRRCIYPDNGDHDHCLFTWETIASYTGQREGYWSDKYGWITVDAYEKFIVNDVYRLRSVDGGA